MFKEQLCLNLHSKLIQRKYLLLTFKIKILSNIMFRFNRKKNKYEIFAENIYVTKIYQVSYNKFINFFCIRFNLFK